VHGCLTGARVGKDIEEGGWPQGWRVHRYGREMGSVAGHKVGKSMGGEGQ
jgi:hypothetical protein